MKTSPFPLAVSVLIAGTSLLSVFSSTAHAGHWQGYSADKPNVPKYTVPIRSPLYPEYTRPMGGSLAYVGPYPDDPEVALIGQGGTGSGGTVTAEFQWIPDTGKTMITDPPPTSVCLLEYGSAQWSAHSGNVTFPGDGPILEGRPSNPSVHDAMYQRGQKGRNSGPHLLLVQVQTHTRTGTANNGLGVAPDYTGPYITTTDGGKSESCKVSAVTPNADGKISVTRGLSATVTAFVENDMTDASWKYRARILKFSPSPDNIALDDGSTKGLNQYLINEGIIPTNVTVDTGNAEFGQFLQDNTTWTLTGPSPAIRPLLPNYKEQSANSTTVGPQHPSLVTSNPPNPTPVPEKGLRFDLGSSSADGTTFSYHWPVDNSEFGAKTLNHNVDGITIPVPVALFYLWNGTQHPPGSIHGYWHDATGHNVDLSVSTQVPNWVYYYDKAWTNPWGIPVSFWASNSSYSNTDSTGEHMYVGYDTHGANTGKIETDLFAFAPGFTGLQWVGTESTRGIDVYKRVVSHECTHLLLQRMKNAGATDNDPDPKTGIPVGDGLPDVLETYVSASSPGNGLDPSILDTSAWIATQVLAAGLPAGTPTGYDGYPDEEVFCRMTEHGLFGPMDQDWANDGLNYDRPAPPNRINRIALHLRPGYSTSTLTYSVPGSVPVLPAPTPVPTPTPTPGGTP